MANTSGDSGRLVRKDCAQLPATRLEPESALISAVKKIEERIMARASTLPASDILQAMLETYLVNDRMNQFVLEHLDPRAWRAKPPGGNARTIAAIFAHMHNVRRKWLRLSAPHLKLPAELDRSRCTQKQARAALAVSATRCGKML